MTGSRGARLAILAALGAAAGPRAQPPAEDGRRLLLITLDTVRADALSCYGGRPGLTPNLDALARRGTLFARALAPMPETVPSHASMLTGRYPFSHGITSNFLSLSEEVETAAEIAARAGAATAALYHVVPFGAERIAQGFELDHRDQTKMADEIAPRFLAWWDELPEGKPAFAWLHYYVAHDPYEPPAELAARFVEHPYLGPMDTSEATRLALSATPELIPPGYARGLKELYEAEVAALDAIVGGVLDELGRRGSLDSTLVIVVADHGESFERAEIGTHALVWREPALQTPLVVAGPGVRAGIAKETVALVDLFPTMLEWLGLEAPDGIDGRSLWPLLRGGEEPWESLAFGSLPVLLGGPDDQALPRALMAWSGRFKLMVIDPAGEGTAVLRDLSVDPDERADATARHPDVAKALRRRVESWLAATRARRTPPGEISEESRRLLEALGYGK